MKQLKLLIIILSLFAIGLLIVLIVLNSKNQKPIINTVLENTEKIEENIIDINDVNETIENTIVEYDNPDAPVLTYNTDIREIEDNSTLYTLTNNINKYFQYIKDNNMQAVVELGGNDKFIIQNDFRYSIRKAYVTENNNISKYYTYGVLTITNGDHTATEQDIYMIVYLDYINNLYKVELMAENQNISALEQEENALITNGAYNKYEVSYIDDVKQIEMYLENYVFQAYNNTEKSYYLLEENYRNETFGDLNNYIQFLQENANELQNITLTQYDASKEDNYMVYIGLDQFGNYYYIKANSYMEYELRIEMNTIQENTEENIEIE